MAEVEEKQYPPLTIVLANRSRSSWVLEGTENDREPQYMDYPSTYRVCETSKVKESATSRRYKQIRYISTSDSIDPVKQKEEGAVPDPVADKIFIDNGNRTILREGSTVGLYDYLTNYQGNGNNPLRPDDAEIEFYELREVEIAAGKVRNIDTEFEAIALLSTMRKKQMDGTYAYDEDMLRNMAIVFNIESDEAPDQIFLQLVDIARAEPTRIIESATNPVKLIVLDIKKALALSVIKLDPERAFFNEDNSVILRYKGKSGGKAAQIEELANFLNKSENKIFLDQLRVKNDTAEEKSLAELK